MLLMPHDPSGGQKQHPVSEWERGEKKPNGSSLKLLNVVRAHYPDESAPPDGREPVQSLKMRAHRRLFGSRDVPAPR
jgi:hypothetical protein